MLRSTGTCIKHYGAYRRCTGCTCNLHAAELVPALTGRAQAYARPSIVHPQEPTCIAALWPGLKISYLHSKEAAQRSSGDNPGAEATACERWLGGRNAPGGCAGSCTRNQTGTKQWRVAAVQCRFVRTPFGLGGYEALIGASTPWTAALIWS